MNNSVNVRDRHKARLIDTRVLRKITIALLGSLLPSTPIDLAIYILAGPEMTRLNETFLSHKGSTDVLAFDYTQPGQQKVLYGEIFVCQDEAIVQSGQFGTTWQNELVRYVIHGVLHLTGHDDHHPARRRKMKLEENRLLKQLGRQFDFSQLAR